MDTTKIREEVVKLLEREHIKYEAQYKGFTVDGKHEMDQWLCTLSTDRVHEEFDFYTGLGHRSPPNPLGAFRKPRPYTLAWHDWQATRKPVPPHPAELLYCLFADSYAVSTSFESWCSEFGYDTDSRKALDTYLGCQDQTHKLRRVIPAGLVWSDLELLLQDY